MKEFVRKVRFDRMGAFAYSEEEGTYAAAHYEDEIPQEVKLSLIHIYRYLCVLCIPESPVLCYLLLSLP